MTCVLLLLKISSFNSVLGLVNSKLASSSFLHMRSYDSHEGSKIGLSSHASCLGASIVIVYK